MAASTREQVLAPVQQRGQEALVRLGLPTRKHEAWRLTNLGRLEAVARMPISGVATASDAPPRLDDVVRLVLDGVNDPLEASKTLLDACRASGIPIDASRVSEEVL